MRVLAAIVVVPALLLGWQWWSDHSLEQRLKPIASGVAGRSVDVDCQSIWGELLDAQWREGEVYFDASGRPDRKLFLTRRICKRLRSLAESTTNRELDCLRDVDWSSPDPLPLRSTCYSQSADTIYAVLILAHESYHTAGVRDEATANCFAIQAMAWTAGQLGIPTDKAELLAQAMAALESEQPSGYETAECRAGLRLDLHPETTDFPTEHPLGPPLGAGGSARVTAET